MADGFDGGSQRHLVVTPYQLPAWATPPANEFDVRRLADDDEACASAEVMLTSGPETVGPAIIDRLPALRYICCLGSGYEGVDAVYAASRGIAVSNSAIVTAEDVADQLLTITLALCSQVPLLDRAVRAGEWPKPIRPSLRYRKVGIVGLGAIGKASARRIAAFGCEIRWTGRRARPSEYVFCADLLELADWSDILLTPARADASNRRMIGPAVFEALGPSGIVANVSRGSIIDEDALIAALMDGRLGGAALDVFKDEPTPAGRWDDVPNTVLSPHVGGFTTGVRRGIYELVLTNLRAYFAGRPLVGTVADGRTEPVVG
jgi:lactate dehydrogenase-like 2-hydroxyacid dehydrogenase